MGFIKSNGEGLKGVSVTDPRLIFTDLLKTSSGVSYERSLRYNIFYQFVAFKGVREGIGTSTIVSNTALAMAKLGLNVCVVDTSILNPCQDILLKTNYDRENKKEGVTDWFSMGFTRNSVLNISGIDRKVSVLSFKNRTIVDLLSTQDSAAAVEFAFSQLATKFDIILIDICNEPTNISTTAMQLAHKLIQVWSNSVTTMRNVENFITNNVICSCSMDKMRYVVTSMTVDDIPTNWDELMKKFHFKHLAHVGMSMEIAHMLATGRILFNAAVNSPDVQQFNDCITDIVCHLLNINPETGKSNATYTPAGVINDNSNSKEKFAEVKQDYPEVGEKGYQDTSSSEDYIKSYESSDDDLDLFDEEPAPAAETVQEAVPTKAKRGFFGRGGKK